MALIDAITPEIAGIHIRMCELIGDRVISDVQDYHKDDRHIYEITFNMPKNPLQVSRFIRDYLRISGRPASPHERAYGSFALIPEGDMYRIVSRDPRLRNVSLFVRPVMEEPQSQPTNGGKH